jgi:putative SOS response-associated peptidase YedK
MLVSGREAYAWCHECGSQRQIDILQLCERVGGQYSLINRRSPCLQCGAWMRFHYRQAALYPMWDQEMSWQWDKIDRGRQFGMCNRYEIYLNHMKQVFGRSLEDTLRGINLPSDEINPGGQGVVWGGDERVYKMQWGFTTPKFSKRDPNKPIKPAIWNNARSENLHIPLWRESFATRRCLIPVMRFAEAEGPPGNMTRTWYSVPRGDHGDGDHFSIAGIWREEEQGSVYSMVMTSSAPPVARIHDRMPVIIAPQDRESWLLGSPEQAKLLCRSWAGPLDEDRTPEKWYRAKGDVLNGL